MMSLAWTPPQLRDTWRTPLAVTVGLVALILLGYHETAAAMVGIWIRSETFTHAFVVPPLVAWMIWRKRGELAPLQPRSAPAVLLPMAGLALLWWLGHLVNVAAAMQLALVAMLVATVPLVLGWQVSRVLVFPLAFMFFAVPIGEFLTPTLMRWTVDALVALLRLTGIPVYQEGQHLVIPSGRWAVVAACSGIRYLMATFMVGSLFAYLNYSDTRKRLIFVAVSIVLPVLANWMRAYIIVMLGHLSNNQIATGVDHVVYGWVFFGVVIMALFFIGVRWADPDGMAAAASLAQRQADEREDAVVPGWRPVAMACAALLVLLWPIGVQRDDAPSAGPAQLQLSLPAALGNWQAVPLAVDDWEPYFPTATARVAKAYAGPQGRVDVRLAYYRRQGGDVKLVSSANGLVKPEDNRWHVLAEGVATSPSAGGETTWRRFTVLEDDSGQQNSLRRRLTVWQLYWIGGPLAHSDVRAKLLQAWQAVRGEPDDGAVIHLVSDLQDDAAAQRQIAAFVGENFTMLQRTLAQVRESR